MTRKGKWTTFASGLEKLSGRGGTSWEFPRKHSPIYANWTAHTLAELNAVSGTWRSSISKRLH